MVPMLLKLLKKKSPSFSLLMNSAIASVKADLSICWISTEKACRPFLSSIGEKPFRATQLLKWIYQEGVTDFDEMTNLSKSLRSYLTGSCQISSPRTGCGTWPLMAPANGWWKCTAVIALKPFIFRKKDGLTLCVSSQVGCALACSFCSTAQQGFNRNLAVSEIIGQLYLAQQTAWSDVKSPMW